MMLETGLLSDMDRIIVRVNLAMSVILYIFRV